MTTDAKPECRMCGPIAAMLIMVFFTLLPFLEETLSCPHPAGDYAFQCFFDEFTPQNLPMPALQLSTFA